MLPHPFKAHDSQGHYQINQPVHSQDIIKMANYLTRQRLKKGTDLSSPEKSYDYLQTLLQNQEREVFGVILLDQQHRIIQYQELFQGTINQASVYPREIVKQALMNNAAAVILVHNHPSGDPTPSMADKQLTQIIKEALALVDIRTLDHLVVGHEGYRSLAKMGWL
ncbi:DNA repair protein RadC [Thiosulfatimonas sediminis]|uniref:DNA repair protein RadC n=1 Tax=Thiosulfatimonas sediminis TaxID=2675054 RepID=A0A6F8PSL1_9GAMM|nr:DNA repair protein RadC [Thiosulfatimonas sediminis]BBP45105.1 DNA repair protein RadC [Thiosulfatimonas sediminis]